MSVNVDWMQEALCREVSGDLWFPESVGVAGQREAQAAVEICKTCPVVLQCREYGKRFSRGYGIWGGVVRSARPARERPAKEVFITHGTDAGYKAHTRRGEKACVACLQAHRLAHTIRRERREA